MANLFRKKNAYLGIEVKDSLIKLAEVQQGKKSHKILNYAFHPIPQGIVQEGRIQNENEFDDVLKSLLKKVKITSRQVHLSISSENILLRPIRLQPLPLKQLRKAVEIEIMNNIQLPFQDFVFDYAIIDQTEQQLDLMLVIASRQTIETYVRLFQKRKLEVKSVDLAPLAILRLLEWERKEPIPDPFIVINLGESSTEVSIFNRRILRLTRHVPLNFRTYTSDDPWPPDVSRDTSGLINSVRAFSLDLGNEIERITNFYLYTLNNRDQQFTEIIIAGDLPHQAEIAESLSQQLQIPCRIQEIRRFGLFSLISEDDLEKHAAQLAVPVALAIKDVKRHGN